MDEIGAAVNDISASAGQPQKDSEEMQWTTVEKAGEGMEKIMTGSARSVESVWILLRPRSMRPTITLKKIDEAVLLIFSISGQTNLSLNASIEAARAGEAGRGICGSGRNP